MTAALLRFDSYTSTDHRRWALIHRRMVSVAIDGPCLLPTGWDDVSMPVAARGLARLKATETDELPGVDDRADGRGSALVQAHFTKP
jgi:hypothetical protein